jgi:cation transport ATPase
VAEISASSHQRRPRVDSQEIERLMRLEVCDLIASPGLDVDEMLRLSASLVRETDGVFAFSLVSEASARSLVLSVADLSAHLVGKGTYGTVEGRPVAVVESGLDEGAANDPHGLLQRAESLEAGDRAVLYVVVDGVLVGLAGFTHPLIERMSHPR